MAENDRFEKSLGAGWCASYQYVKNRTASPEEVDDKLVKTLAKYLRKHNGVPGFQAMIDVLAAPAGPAFANCFGALDDIVRCQGGHRHTKIAAQVAKSVRNQQSPGRGTWESKDVAHRLAENVCSALVRHYFFGRVRHPLITESRFTNYEEFHQWQKGVEQSIQPSVERVASQLVNEPNAESLRAPRNTTRKKMSTRDLMDEVLV